MWAYQIDSSRSEHWRRNREIVVLVQIRVARRRSRWNGIVETRGRRNLNERKRKITANVKVKETGG